MGDNKDRIEVVDSQKEKSIRFFSKLKLLRLLPFLRERETSNGRNANYCILGVKPYKHEPTLPVAEEFIRALSAGVYSFEIWSIDKRCKVFICSNEYPESLKRKIISFHPTAEVYDSSEIFPAFKEELDKVAVARVLLDLKYHPIRTDISDDPLNALLAVISEHQAIYQVVFTPAPMKYAKQILKMSRNVQEGKVVGWLNPRVIPPGKFERDLSKALADKSKDPLYYVDIRVCVFGDDAEKTINDFSSYFELFRWGEQGFKIKIAKGLTRTGTLKRKRRALMEMILRKSIGTNVLSAKELSLLAHIPGKEVTGDLEWSLDRKDVYLPDKVTTKIEEEL